MTAGRPRLLELRAEKGEAALAGGPATRIEARSVAFFPQPAGFGGEAERIFATLLDALPKSGSFHLRRVREERTIFPHEGEPVLRSARLVSLRASAGGSLIFPLDLSVPERLLEALDLLEMGPPERLDVRGIPIAWTGGTAAVLLHEALGHPAEADADPIRWPDWLEVLDEPEHDGLGTMPVDDHGVVPTRARLTGGERPDAFRRASFRDVPLRRMTNLVVRTDQAPAELPDPRLEVLLLAGGRWDAAADVVELRVARARLVRGGSARTLAPFTWRAPRTAVAASLRGAIGPVVAYPGVICAVEGQRVAVGSFSPTLVMEAPGW